jgi:hypothetical protein
VWLDEVDSVARVKVRGFQESTRFYHHAARIASFSAVVRFPVMARAIAERL